VKSFLIGWSMLMVGMCGMGVYANIPVHPFGVVPYIVGPVLAAVGLVFVAISLHRTPEWHMRRMWKRSWERSCAKSTPTRSRSAAATTIWRELRVRHLA